MLRYVTIIKEYGCLKNMVARLKKNHIKNSFMFSYSCIFRNIYMPETYAFKHPVYTEVYTW